MPGCAAMKSSAASCVPTTEPGPLEAELGPFRSVSTPIRMVWLDCARAARTSGTAAAEASTARRRIILDSWDKPTSPAQRKRQSNGKLLGNDALGQAPVGVEQHRHTHGTIFPHLHFRHVAHF